MLPESPFTGEELLGTVQEVLRLTNIAPRAGRVADKLPRPPVKNDGLSF